MSYGLTEGGFVIPTLEEIISERLEGCKLKYGTDFQDNDDNQLWQHQLIDAERESAAWQMAEAVYYSQTLAGAEDIYLDDALGLRGFYRNPATASSGYAVIESNRTISNSTTIPTTSNFNANTGVIYKVDDTTEFTDRVVGCLVKFEDFIGTINYTFNYVAPETSISHSVSSTVSGGNNTQVTNFFNNIVTSILDNTNLTADEVFVLNANTDQVSLHLGYSDTYALKGVSEPSNYSFSPTIGLKAGSFFVIATSKGFNPLSTNGIISICPSNIGFTKTTNVEEFNSGTDVESDTVYRLRAASQTGGTALGSEARLIQAIEEVDGVTAATIFSNPSAVEQGGVAPLSFEAVVTGGSVSEIASTIYKNKAITDNTSGQVSYSVLTSANRSEVIRFSRSEATPLNIKISYTTTTDGVLSNTEQGLVNKALESYSDSFTIGGLIFNASLQSTIFSSLSVNRLANLIVEVKLVSEPDTEYSTSNLRAENRQIFTIDSNNISYTRI